MERIYNQQMMRREKQMVARGLAKAPPDYTVTLRLWMPQMKAVTEEGDEDRKGREWCQATRLQCDEDTHTVMLRESPSVLPPGSASPFLTCARHLGDFSIPTPWESEAGPEQCGPQGDGDA